jgi:lipoprotein-anchoring transpeptidase ErfK/SrfK
MEMARRVMPSTARSVVAGLAGAVALLLAADTGAAAAPAGLPCSATAQVCVDLSAQQAWLLRDGNVTYGPVPVATGMASAPTEQGTFRVFWKHRHHRSSLFNNAPMPYSVFYNGDEAFHQGSTTDRSHGCVHLSKRAAQVFYHTLHVDDVVQIVR